MSSRKKRHQIKPSEFILNPFNLDRQGYLNMFNSIPPTTLVMPIVLFTEPGADQQVVLEKIHLVEDKIVDAAGDCATGKLSVQIHEIPDVLAYLHGERQEVTWEILPDTARAWAHDGIYVEAGYYSHEVAGKNLKMQEVVNAMMLYDVAVANSGCVEPSCHHPLLVGNRFAKEWTAAIGDLYQAKVGIWCRDLLDHRTMILIISRALLMGRDPVQEYKRFINAGGKYFLEYPTLCP